jgi:DNA-binding NtrC family response regulator
MEAHGLNLFIVDDDRSMVTALKNYLSSKFGARLNISTFTDGESALRNINEDTDVVILDYFLHNKNGNEILRSIKERNPRTEVIMLSGNENLETAIESFKLGAKNYVVKSNKSIKKIAKLINSLFWPPLKSLNEMRVTRVVPILLVALLSLSAGISLVSAAITFFINLIP